MSQATGNINTRAGVSNDKYLVPLKTRGNINYASQVAWTTMSQFTLLRLSSIKF